MINKNKLTELNETLQIAGIMPCDSSIEFIGVKKNKTVLWLQNGTARYFTDLPKEYYNLLKQEYLSKPKAVAFLSKISSVTFKQVELFTYYMYGDIDNTPDIKNGVLAPSENFRDTQNCPSLLWDCKKMTIGSHTLTPRQLIIIDLMAADVPDKGIAAALGIAINTLDFHKNKLFTALGVKTRTALVILALQFKVIN